jgi:hypothetical protein
MREALMFVAFCTIMFGLFAIIDLTLKYAKAGYVANIDVATQRLTIAAFGTAIATALTAYSRFYLDADEASTEGFEFVSAGCFAWIPIFHMASVSWWQSRSRYKQV